jgi:hypothetical protein
MLFFKLSHSKLYFLNLCIRKKYYEFHVNRNSYLTYEAVDR